ncbi:hypothetical protein GQ457_07G022740 [Hibiscus cannabinus]
MGVKVVPREPRLGLGQVSVEQEQDGHGYGYGYGYGMGHGHRELSLSTHARSAAVAESLAIRFGLEIAIKIGLDHIQIESDNLNIINRIVSKNFSSWETAAIEENIVALSCRFSSCSFSFILRCCNQTADWVARNFRTITCPEDWPVNVPPGLRTLL